MVVGRPLPPDWNACHRHVLRDDHRHPDQRKLRLQAVVGRIDLLRLCDGRTGPEHTEQIKDPIGEACMIQMVDDHFRRGRVTTLHRRRDTRRTGADPRMPTAHVALPCWEQRPGERKGTLLTESRYKVPFLTFAAHSAHCLLQVGHEVVDRLDANRQPHEVARDLQR